MAKRILYVTDYPVGAVSGYAGIAKALCTGLVNLGYDVKVIGIGNKGEEHWENFSIIPVDTLQEAQAAIHNLSYLWKQDIVITAMDIPMQIRLFKVLTHKNYKHIAITPMENGPLCQTWAAGLLEFDRVFFISELGKKEAEKVGLRNVDHLQIGINLTEWFPARDGEKKLAREKLGFLEDEKVILTVADNQERKNLWAGMAIIQKMKKDHPDEKFKYVIVTRLQSIAGWNLQDLAYSMNIQNEFIGFERGINQEKLRLLFVCADAYLQTSKAEGYGLPILEAMAMRLPVVATNTGAMSEILADGRGWLVPSDYDFIDCWGNSLRSMISIEKGSFWLSDALIHGASNSAYLYAKTLSWNIGTNQIKDCIEELCKN